MSWTPAASHLMKQRPRKRGPRHEGSESTKWKEEISYPDSETLMSIYVFFRCFILLLWFMEIHYLDVTRGCVLAVLGYTYLNNMCIHMDNFLYGVLQSIADYGIETWKISWASSKDSVRASSLFCPTNETAVRDFEAEPLWHLWFDALHQRMTELQNDGGRVWVWEDVGNIF